MKTGINWKNRYEIMKKGLEELNNLRHVSVAIDAENLSQKIEEHKKIHEISVAELKSQNESMRQELKNVKEINKKIQILKKNVTALEIELTNKAPLFSVALKFPNISLVDGIKGSYVFECGGDGDDAKFQFRISDEDGESIIYEPLTKVPNNWKPTNWMEKKAKFKRGAIRVMFSSISQAVA